MKILICGKGGSGKSTITALLAIAMKKRYPRILVVDADESNIGLYRMLGVDLPQPLMDYFGGKKGFRQKTANSGTTFGSPPGIFPENMALDDLPKTCVAAADGIFVMPVGKIHDFGRRLDAQCDRIICIVDPSYESVMMAQKVNILAGQAGLPAHFILNKTTPEIKKELSLALDGLHILGSLDAAQDISVKNLKGQPLDICFPEIEQICDALVT